MECADLVIEIPSNSGQANAFYRLNYDPPFGSPPPNTTIASRDVGDEIQFSQGLPGTRYNFWLYYTNETHNDWLTWTVSITTGKSLFTPFNDKVLIDDVFSISSGSTVQSVGGSAHGQDSPGQLESTHPRQLLVLQAEDNWTL